MKSDYLINNNNKKITSAFSGGKNILENEKR